MTEYQNIRNKLIAVPKDQVITPAGKLDRIKQDATLWPLKGGLKHYKGWALCDGSAYDANVFPELDAALNGAGVVPNGAYRTRALSLVDTGVTATPPGWSLLWSELIAYSDDNGNWRFKFNISANATAFTIQSLTINGITFKGNNVEDVPVVGIRNGSAVTTIAFADATTGTITVIHSANDTSFKVSGDVALESKPTWADANLEDYPIIATADNVLSSSIGLPKADKETAGLVSYGDINQVLENECINGSFDFNQRGAASYTATAEYTLDRHRLDVGGGETNTITQEQFAIGQTEVAGNPKNYLKAVSTTGNLPGGYSIISTRLEDVTKYSGEWVTVGVDLKADAAKDISIEFVQTFGSGGSPSATVQGIEVNKLTIGDTWQRYYVTAFIPSISGKTLGSNGNDYFQVLFWFSAGSDFNARTNSLGNQSGTFEIANLDIKRTRHQTPFTRAGGTYAGELALCQRYFERLGRNLVYIASGSSTQSLNWQFSVEKRTTPSVSYTATAGSLSEFYVDTKCHILTGSPGGVSPSIRVGYSNAFADSEL